MYFLWVVSNIYSIHVPSGTGRNDDDDDKLMCQKYRDGWNNSLVNFSDLNNNCSDDMHTNNKLELGWVAQGMQI